MSRISIEVTPNQHKRLKTLAALSGKSLKEYMLEKTLPVGDDEEEAIQELSALLKPRLAEAKRGEFVDQTVEEIFDEVYQESGQSDG